MRFVHTADLQIGMPFEWAGEGRARPTLKERREEAVENICALATEHDADFVVIAGDFFDANTVGDDVIVRTCKRLGKSDLPVLILPGNHDFASGPNCVYERDKFVSNTPENVFVLSEREPHVLAGDEEVVILPAPIFEKNEVGDTTTHLTADFGREEAEDAIRVGLAHGSVVDFEGGAEPTVEQVSTSQTDWIRHATELREAGDVDELAQWIDDIERPLDTLVRLELSGTLSISEKTRLEDLLSDLEDTVLHLRRRGPGVHTRATPDEIDAIATDGYVREAVEELQATMNGSDGETADDDAPEAQAARDALQLLHQMKSE